MSVKIATGEAETRRAEETLRAVTAGTAAVTGGDFFQSLVRHLAEALQVRYSFVAECTDDSNTRVRTLAFWTGKGFGDEIAFPLKGTPCEGVMTDEVRCYPKDLQSLFPEDLGLVDLDVESYLGVPLHASSGRTLGHLVVMHDQPMTEMEHNIPVLRIFAARAGVELERKRASEALENSKRRLRTLLDINNAIVSKLTRDELFQAISEALSRVIGFDRLALSLYDRELESLRIVTFAGPIGCRTTSCITRCSNLSWRRRCGANMT